MGNSINNKPKWLKVLRLSARIISVAFIIAFTFFLFITGAMLNQPAPASDYIQLASCTIYVIGLLVCFKWERMGALISIGFLAIALIFLFSEDTKYNFGKTYNEIYTWVLILMIPCVLYLVSWYFHRKYETKKSIE